MCADGCIAATHINQPCNQNKNIYRNQGVMNMVSQITQEVGKSIVDLDLETRVRTALAIQRGTGAQAIVRRGQRMRHPSRASDHLLRKHRGRARRLRRVAGVRTSIDAVDVLLASRRHPL